MDNQPKQHEKNTQFKVFLILSMIYGAYGIFSNFILYTMKDAMISLIEQQPNESEYLKQVSELLAKMPVNWFLASIVVCIMSLSGAIMMWRMRKVGFHLYTISRFLLLIAVAYFFPGEGFPWSVVMMSGLFVFVYGMNLKFMK